MTDQEKNKQIAEAFRKFSRRDMLRTSSLATAGVFIMPTFIPRCRKEDFPGHPGGGGGVGEPGINYAAAAANLANLRAWVLDLYPLCIEYEDAVFKALASTKDNTNWKNFIIDIFIDIAVAIGDAAAVATGNVEAIPALACLSAFLHDWGLGKGVPGNLDAEFAAFEFGHGQMQITLEQKLSSLEDPTGGYANLKSAWGDQIIYQGKPYTIGDLASSSFPTSNEGDKYNPLQTASYVAFQKRLWNLVIMKCCTPYRNYYEPVQTPYDQTNSLLTYMRETYYPNNKGQYVRADMEIYDNPYITWYIYAYNLGIDGNPFPDEAANILFIDDTPGHVINPKGLFNRSYVFEQFSFTKPVFEYGTELGADNIGNLNHQANDWDFTAGYFPYLAKIE